MPRSGGQALPLVIEEIPDMVTHLRDQSYPVFPDDIVKWAAQSIEWTFHASFFPDGKPPRGWYVQRVDAPH